MNYKPLAIIALVALCLCVAVPASAMWNNGNWLPDNANDGYKVYSDPATGVTSKYKDINPANEIKSTNEGNGGVAVGSIRAGYSTLSQTIYVRNVLQDKNGSPMVVAVNPDATFRIPAPDNGVLAPGDYEATLDNFNLPDETVRFTIAANQQEPTRISFLGQAVSAVPVLYPMSIKTDIDNCNVMLNGLKLVKDELITVPESTKRVPKRVKVIDQPYVPAVPGTPEQGHWITVVDVPAQPAVPAVTHQDYEAGHVHARKTQGNSQHDFDYNNDKYQITGNSHDDAFIVTSHSNARKANLVTIIDVPAVPAVPAVTHQAWIVDVPAVPAVPAIQERSHYEIQYYEVIVPSYSYWTYKLEGRLTVKSLDTEITNPNGIPLSGTATVVVEYTVDHNFGHILNTNQDLENMRKTFTGRFEDVAPGVNDYGNVPIVFSDRINDAIIVDDYFPSVIESSIVTDVPWGYHMN